MDVVGLIEKTNPGEHVYVLHGDMKRTGVEDRYSWSCRCGAGSERNNMTVKEALKDFRDHCAEEGD